MANFKQAQPFKGQLNSNEIYSALYNINILFQIFNPQNVMLDPIVAEVSKATGKYGDKGIVHGLDIQGTYNFLKDLEADKLLLVNRNKSSKIEEYVINKWRQTDVTNDVYISKRAFLNEGTFSVFNGYVVTTMKHAFTAYENGYVKTALGCYQDINVEVNMPAINGSEDTYRRRAAAIRNIMTQLKVKMKDNSRDWNKYKQYASFDLGEFKVIFNLKYVVEADAFAFYNMFNPEKIKEAYNGDIWSQKWFGNRPDTDFTADDNSYMLTECNSDGTNNFPITDTQIAAGVYRLFPGDKAPTGFAFKNGTDPDGDYQGYKVDDNVICIICKTKNIYFMTGFQQSDAFYNPRAALTNHYMRKGYSDVMISGFTPFIRLVEKTIPQP